MESPKDRSLNFVSRAELIAAPPARVFSVLEDPALLGDLMPGFLDPELIKGPWLMAKGETIELRLTFWGVPSNWKLVVEEYTRGELLVQRMLEGPLLEFEHRQMVQVSEEGTRLVDLVSYRVRFGLLGQLFNRLVLRSDIEHILLFRNERLRQMLVA